VYSMLALSLVPTIGGVGLLPLAQLMFAAIGAVVVGSFDGRVPFLLALPLAAAVASIAGALVGALAGRLRGAHFAVATLSLAAAGEVVLGHTSPPGFRSSEQLQLPDLLSSSTGLFVAAAITFTVLALGVRAVQHSMIGHRWEFVRFSERAAAAAALPVGRIKVRAVALSAALAGVAGAFMVAQNGFLTVGSVAPVGNLLLVAVAMIAGTRTVAGSAIAGLVAIGIPELFRRLGLPGDVAPIVFGIAAVLTLRGGQPTIAEQVGIAFRRLRPSEAPGADRQQTTVIDNADVAPRQPPLAERSARADGVVLRVSDVSVSFGAVRALDHVELVVPAATVVGLIGPNGAGKSTLIDVITGFAPRHDGDILLAGTSLLGHSSAQRAGLGLRRTFQQGRAVPTLTVADYLAVCAGHDLTEDALDSVIRSFALPSPPTVIGDVDVVGRRIIELAGAVIAAPAVVLVDEPAAGLGRADSERLARAIADVPARWGSAVLLVEHDTSVIRTACSYAYVLDDGALLAEGTPDDVLHRNDVVAAYLGAADDD
jgi:branched-chain amino acid transport system permease protein